MIEKINTWIDHWNLHRESVLNDTDSCQDMIDEAEDLLAMSRDVIISLTK